MEIEIETNFIPLILAYEDMPPGVTKKIILCSEMRNGISEGIAIAIFSFGTGVTASLFASWIYDKLKKHKDHKIYLKINRKEITIDKTDIIRVIEEITEIKK